MTLLDDANYDVIAIGQAQIESFIAAGTKVDPYQQMNSNCKEVVGLTLQMLGHAHQAAWETITPL